MSSRRPEADPTSSDPTTTGDAPARHSLGPQIAAVPDPAPLRPAGDRHVVERPDATEGMPGAWFAVVLRGYDRAQVDARLAELDRRIRDEIVRADTAEAAVATARAHVRRLQDSGTPGAEDRGFGQRVERVLNAAEHEAAALRAKASDEASALLDKARADAERARKQTEEALLGRAAKLDDEFTSRSSALDAREQEVDRIVERARAEAEEIRAEAERRAAEETAAAESRAADLLREAERTIERQRADATRDIGRMAALRDEVRQELARLHGLLRGELDEHSVPAELGSVSGVDTAVEDLDDVRSDASADERSGRDDDRVSTAVGAIPPFTTSSIGVLPFGDRSAGGPANGRSFAFGLVPGMRADDADDPHGTDEAGTARTSDDAADHDPVAGGTPTRSTMPSRGRR
ncbi:hypothetical protein [Pseudonocardia endophytica]|nr:hypothetical protein [Pseudonocardia endophytica]